jgi:hypothetical protein
MIQVGKSRQKIYVTAAIEIAAPPPKKLVFTS